MKSFACDENFISMFYQEYSSIIHKRKLDQIKNRKNLTMSVSLEPKGKAKTPKGFLNIAKIKEVSRENKLLHNKLLVISERKTQPKSWNKSPKTLNLGVRKKYSDKIIEENSSIIQRLLEKSSRLSAKQMKIEYEMSQKYKENLSKIKGIDRLKKIIKGFTLPSAEKTQEIVSRESCKEENNQA